MHTHYRSGSSRGQNTKRYNTVIRGKVQKTGSKKPEEYTLVGAGEEDYDEGKILVSSPLAQGLLGKKKGEVATIQLPNREIELTVLDVSYE